MKKTKQTKIQLDRQTIRNLSDAELRLPSGGGDTLLSIVRPRPATNR